jgi:catechol 2,3-dioxygenase-like lactoylglutathione lyase family enzyme
VRLHVDIAAIHALQRLGPPVTPFMTLLSARINCCMLAIRNGLFIRDRPGGEGGQMEVNGIAHIFLTASNFDRSREFYRKLLPFLGLKPVIDSDATFYCVGGRTAIGINAPAPEHAGRSFEQNRVGLHHLCFRARERADVDELHGFLCSLGVTIIRAPREDQWAPGYYSLLFEDPDGIRLELNHVPGKGLLA